MKAWIADRYGAPDLLRMSEVERPQPKRGEVLVKVLAATVNRTDTCLLRGIPPFARLATGLLRPKNPILGGEFAGVIEELGEGVTTHQVGEGVYGMTTGSFGAHAEYLTIDPSTTLERIPKGLDFSQAAASIESAYYAYYFLNKLDLEPGQRVLVNGATGGIGSALVQMLRYHGLEITAVCRSEHFELVRSLGAERLIDYVGEDFTELEGGYDFVMDAVGKSSFGRCKPLLRPGGVYISSELGAKGQNLALALVGPLLGSKRVRFPLPLDCRASMLFVKGLIERGEFRAVIDRSYPFERMPDAYRYVEAGQKLGNVVIEMQA